MKKLLLAFLLCPVVTFAQSTKAILYFDQKPTCSEPALSQQAKDRRTIHNIALNSSDCPVDGQYLTTLAQNNIKILAQSRWLNAVLVELTGEQVNKQFDFVIKTERFPQQKLRASKKSKYLSKAKAAFSDRNFELNKGKSLHERGYTGKNIHIAVFDAGFQGVDTITAFKHLFTKGQLSFTKDLVGNTTNPYQYDDHGTMVLSTMAAQIEGSFTGTAPNATYSLFVTEDVSQERRIEEFNWAVAAEMADSIGVNVINSSLGYTRFDEPSENYLQSQMDGKTAIISRAASQAAQKGILVVSSAGNEGSSSWGTISAPADADSILSVGAVKTDASFAGFSSPGPSADGRVKPEICALGQQSAVINSAGELMLANGTSFSAPIFAGLAASLWEAKPNLSNMELRQLIIASGNTYFAPTAKCGYGIPNMELTLNQLIGLASYLIVFPNPANEEVRISWSKSPLPANLSLIDAMGKTVYSTTVNELDEKSNFKLPNEAIGGLQEGIYLIKIKADGFNKTLRFVVR